MSKKNVKLEYDGKSFEFPVITGTENESAFDIGKLRDQSGLVTMDNGFANTSTCQSAITFLDGDRGILRYRGYPIEELAEKSNFLETAFLLIYGYLPTGSEFEKFSDEISRHSLLHEDVVKLIESFPRNTHPMAVVSACVSALSGIYADELDPANPEFVRKNTVRLLAKLPTIAAHWYKVQQGLPRIYPDASMDYCGSFLKMMFAFPTENYSVPKEVTQALHLLLILHADHEQNCSTSTVRLVGSSGANLFGSISAGVQALWGPLHGGANQAVMEMLDEIHKDGGDVDKYVGFAKDKNSTFRLMGFGHRVYKNFDPRASIIKKACDKVLSTMGVSDPRLAIAKKLEEAALKDSYFVERKLYPNVDFYSGIIYSAMGIPVDFFTVLFAIGRLPGWVAHWKEMNDSGTAKIGRPRQIYNGSNVTKFVPVKERKPGSQVWGEVKKKTA